MTKNKKVLLGILSFLPFIFFIVYMSTFLSFMFEMVRHEEFSDGGSEFPAAFTSNIIGIVVSAIIMGLLSLGVLVFFIIHAINNPIVKSDERIIWILLFIFLGMVVFPIYWYMKIWKQPTVEA